MKYFSENLNKLFDTEEELKAAEKSLEDQKAAKSKLAEEKKARAEEVQQAFVEYQKVQEKALAEIAEAEKKWIDLRDKFAKDYNGYHMTYVNTNGKKVITFGDLVDSFFKDW